MKGRNLIFISILVLAVGVLLLIARRSIGSDSVVTVGGVLFILAGVFNVLVADYSRKRSQKGESTSSRGPVSATMAWISSVAAIILGVCMLLFKGTFTPLVPVMFGILVAFAAFYQLYLLAIGIRPVVLPAFYYIAPLLLAATAVWLFTLEGDPNDARVVIITGVSLLIFGAAGVAEGVMLGSENRLMKKEGATTPEAARMLRDARREAQAKAETETHAAETEPKEESKENTTEEHSSEATADTVAEKEKPADGAALDD